jgi:hypothetical protein
LEKETPTKKQLEGGKRKGKILESALEMQDKKMFPLNPKKKQSLAWVWHLFMKFQRLPFGPFQLRKRLQL